jgi:hypothetical protein
MNHAKDNSPEHRAIEKAINKERKKLFEKVARRQKELGLSNHRLGYLINSSTTHVKRIMSGDHSIDLLTLLRVLIVLKLELVVDGRGEVLVIDVVSTKNNLK